MRRSVVVLCMILPMLWVQSEWVAAKAQTEIVPSAHWRRKEPAPTPPPPTEPAPTGRVNSITVSNVSGVAISNYPFQFGRPFVDGAIAAAPQVLINGTPLKTQADVKNRYAGRLGRIRGPRRGDPEPPGRRLVDPDLSEPDREQQRAADPARRCSIRAIISMRR